MSRNEHGAGVNPADGDESGSPTPEPDPKAGETAEPAADVASPQGPDSMIWMKVKVVVTVIAAVASLAFDVIQALGG